MHSDELLRLFDEWACYEGKDPIVMIIKELITRSDLQTAAIVALAGDDKIEAVEKLVAHVAPKKKYTVEDIKRGISNVDWHYIYCGEYGYSTSGWCKQRPDGSCFKKEVADVIYAGLRATNNLPKG